MKVIDAERAIREALAEGGAKFAELGLTTEGYVLFSDAKYMQCEPEESKYMTVVLAIKTEEESEVVPEDAIDEESPSSESEIESEDDLAEDEAEDEDAADDIDEDEDDESSAHVYEIDFGFDVKNGEIADSDVESAILTFLEDCDELKEKLSLAEDVGAMLDELRQAGEAEYLELLKKLKKIRIGFLAAAGLLALVVILAIIL